MITTFILLCVVGSSVPAYVPRVGDITPRQGEACGYESCVPTDPSALNVHIVPHTHDDVGWLKTIDQYYFGSRNNIQKAGVQYIIDSVVKELWEDPQRRFIYVETAFFWKWWVRQSSNVKEKVHTLVRQGRLQFVSGAWSMNDEACTHYQSTIDQFTWGLSKLNQTFGHCGLPTVGWQIDPFGHSREFASLLAAMGYDGLFLGRIDYQDKDNRLAKKTMETVWRGDDDLGAASDIMTSVLYNTYSPPAGFCFDVLCNDEPIIDDPDSPMYNVVDKVAKFLEVTTNMSKAYATNNILVTMGEDFQYQDAYMWFTNLDKLIQYTNVKAAQDNLDIKLFYSTPACYMKAVKDSNQTLPQKEADFFPYASSQHTYWTGYFTSRPTTKYFEREANNYLQTVKQLQVLADLEEHNVFVLDELRSAMGVMQHHDAVTGTEKQHVTHDYERILNDAIDDALIIAKQAFNKFIQGGDSTKPPLLSFDRCHLNESRCYTAETSDQFVVTVYNPLAWTLPATPVRLPVKGGDYKVVAPNGDEILSQIVQLPSQVTKIPTRQSPATHELVFLAYDVKPLGYKNFYVQRQEKRQKRQTKNDQNIKDYYHTLNEYWKTIHEKPYVEIRNIEEEITKSITREGKINKPILTKNVGVEDMVDSIKEEDLEMLKDKNKDYNKDIEELEKIIQSASSKIIEMSRFDRRKENTYPPMSGDEQRMLADEPMMGDQPAGDEALTTQTVTKYDDDVFLENPNLKLRVNADTGEITHVVLPTGTEVPFDFKLLYYPGCAGDNVKERSSGAYIFRPNATQAQTLGKYQSKYVQGPVVGELQYTFTDYATGVIRLYNHTDINYIEHEWLVGPIPVDDNIGKEIIVQYSTDIINNGEFYTDSNGRQMLKRLLNKRPDYDLINDEPIAGNYYPVVNEIYIKDDNLKMTVLTDRSEGGASIVEGNVELMLHRRLLRDDAFGVGEPLNETAKGVGLVARGKHRILLSKPQDKEANINIKKKILELHLQPQIFVSDAKHLSLNDYLTLPNCVGGAKANLPEGIHLLTLEPWQDETLLIRIENFLEKSVKEEAIEVDLSKIFEKLNFTYLKETKLAANQYKSGEEINNQDGGLVVKMEPKQIRTFIVNYKYVK